MTKNHGGKRKGAGRKHKYGCKTVSVRIPVNILPYIMTILKEYEQVSRTQKDDISGNSI